MIAHVFLCVLCELRESLLLILSAFGRGTPPIHYGGLGEQGARATRFCPRMTASVRIWPQEFAKTSSALGGQERFLSAVGQRAVPVRRQRGRRPGAPRLAILRAPRETRPPRTPSAEACFRASPPLPQSLPGMRGLRGERRGLRPGVQR